MVAPELLVASDWQQHSLIADLRGSFTGYSLKNERGTRRCRSTSTGRISSARSTAGSTSRATRASTPKRACAIGTDNPGSPNIQANLQRYPLFASFGSTLGGAHNYNRFEIAANGTFDRTVYQESTLSDGTRSSNSDRNFNQYGGALRGSYEIMPHVKPFGEVAIDARERDVEVRQQRLCPQLARQHRAGRFDLRARPADHRRGVDRLQPGAPTRIARLPDAKGLSGRGIADLEADRADHGDLRRAIRRSTNRRCPASPASSPATTMRRWSTPSAAT